MQITTKFQGNTVQIDVREYGLADRFISVDTNIGQYRKAGGGGKVWNRPVVVTREADGTYRVVKHATILNNTGYVLVGIATSAAANSRHVSA